MNPLTNVLTPRARGVLYAVFTVLAVIFAAYQASDGNWIEFVGGVLSALLTLTAASNASFTPTGQVAPPVSPDEEAVDLDEDPDLSKAIESFHGGMGESGQPVVSGNPDPIPANEVSNPMWGDHLRRDSQPYGGEHES